MACSLAMAPSPILGRSDVELGGARLPVLQNGEPRIGQVGPDALEQRHSIIGDVRGRGFTIAVELVKDRQTKEPAPEATAAVLEATRRNGQVVSKSAGPAGMCVQRWSRNSLSARARKSALMLISMPSCPAP